MQESRRGQEPSSPLLVVLLVITSIIFATLWWHERSLRREQVDRLIDTYDNLLRDFP